MVDQQLHSGIQPHRAGGDRSLRRPFFVGYVKVQNPGELPGMGVGKG